MQANCLKDTPIQQNGTTFKHIAKCCPSKFKCKVEGCGAQHNTLLHIQKRPKEENDDKSGKGDGAGKQANSVNISLLENSDAVLLQVVPLRVFGKWGKSVTTYAMLDSGSEITLVDPSLMSSLNLKGQPDELVVSTVSNDNDIQQGCRIDVSVESLVDDEPQRLVLKKCLVCKSFEDTVTSSTCAEQQITMAASSRYTIPRCSRKQDIYHNRDQRSRSIYSP